MDTNLKGRIALITGSGHGIGKAIALSLAEEGADIIICGRDDETLSTTRSEITERYGVKVYKHPIDATVKPNIENLFFETVNGLGRLDILVNNISRGGEEKFGRFVDITDEDWLLSFQTNFMTTVRFARLAIPYLKNSDQARIINISSLVALQIGRFKPQYSVSESALLALTKYLANDLAEHNILVNAVCLSTIDGGGNDGGWNKNIKSRATRENISIEKAELLAREEENKKTPLGRIGTLKDVADAVTFLASSRAGFTTGSCLLVDGGTRRAI